MSRIDRALLSKKFIYIEEEEYDDRFRKGEERIFFSRLGGRMSNITRKQLPVPDSAR